MAYYLVMAFYLVMAHYLLMAHYLVMVHYLVMAHYYTAVLLSFSYVLCPNKQPQKASGLFSALFIFGRDRRQLPWVPGVVTRDFFEGAEPMTSQFKST